MVSSAPPTSTDSPSSSDGAPPLRPISSSLYGSPASSSARLVVGDHPAGEPLALLDDLRASASRCAFRSSGVNGVLDVEVVVEAVLDRRADAELGVREQVLHRLGQHVRGGVPQDRAAVVAGDRPPARPRRRRRSGDARSRSSPLTRAAMTGRPRLGGRGAAPAVVPPRPRARVRRG